MIRELSLFPKYSIMPCHSLGQPDGGGIHRLGNGSRWVAQPSAIRTVVELRVGCPCLRAHVSRMMKL